MIPLPPNSLFPKKKYNYFKYFKIFFSILIFTLFSFLLAGPISLLSSSDSNQTSSNFFYKKDPDLIAVFTGDIGRIPFALKKASIHKHSKILITGVYKKNTVLGIINQKGLEEISKKLDSNMLEIDYLARNTFENVIQTYRRIKKDSGIKTVLIISHDYHISRIKTLISTLIQDKQVTFYYYGIKSHYTNIRSIKLLYKEIYKHIKTYLFLLFFDKDNIVI